MARLVIITDQLENSKNQSKEVLCWNSYEKGENSISIPAYLEEHADSLRRKYLSFIHDLGETTINGKSIVEHMNIDADFSLWWMSHIAEKSPFKSPRIYDCLRLLALEEILKERKPSKLHLKILDKSVKESISILCKKLDIKLSYEEIGRCSIKWSVRSLYQSLPYRLQAIISLRHLFIRWPLRRLKKVKWFSEKNSVFLCSYFYHLDVNAGNKGDFYSKQWEELPGFINQLGKKLNVIHHFLKSPGMPGIQGGIKWLERFNKDADKQGKHSFIESYLSYSIIYRVIKSWIKLNVIAWRLRNSKGFFIPRDSLVDLWPLLKNDWNVSLIGSSAVMNCLWLELFDSALSEMPRQEKGFYLWENQGWESALVYAWRKNGHGSIIGVPHSTIRYWALNNFDDVRTLVSPDSLSKPVPDQLAVNGQSAWNEFVKTSYPVERLIKVEALRYQYLLSLGLPKYENMHQEISTSTFVGKKFPIRILLIGDFAVKQTYKMLHCIEDTQRIIDTKISLTVKPHPACKINQEDFKNIKFTLTDKPLNDIMYDFDMAFSSNTTSGGVDAFLAGLPIVIFLDDSDFNHSPLRGIESVKFAASASDLSLAIKSINTNIPKSEVSDFFWLDSQLPRWKKILIK